LKGNKLIISAGRVYCNSMNKEMGSDPNGDVTFKKLGPQSETKNSIKNYRDKWRSYVSEWFSCFFYLPISRVKLHVWNGLVTK
jgi:hypothetical protein